MAYNFRKIEKYWQRRWREERIYEPSFASASEGKPDRTYKGKFYNLMMFPYPSAEGLHVGNMYAFTGSDIYGRFKRMQGYDVFEPIGLDGFGIHAENYALKIKKHPAEQAKISEKNFYRQLEAIGNGFAWQEKLETYDPEYYKWTQWIFVQMFKRGLAYRKKQPVNWCPSCLTVLADEQVQGGRCERCESLVEKKELEQWFFKITDYAERLLQDLETLDWSEKIKIAQRNWIGKSEGALIDFDIKGDVAPNYVLLHGYTGSPNKNFFPWLKKTLETRDVKVYVPTLPNTDDPRVVDQVEAVLKSIPFDENTILVGHSLGGVVALKIIERLKKSVRRTVLVASFSENKFITEPFEPYVFDWKFDVKKIKANAGEIHILRDIRDDAVPPYQAENIKNLLGGKVFDFAASEPHATGEEEPEILRHCLDSIQVFTTRPDTLFGATYMVLAPEHALIEKLENRIQNLEEVSAYIKKARAKSEEERIEEGKEKSGVELKGIKAINPASKEKIPIWVADYVLGNVGTGAIMAVPAHDARDFEFARKFKLPMRQVIAPHIVDTGNPPREGKKRAPRVVVQGIVKHWKDDTVLQVIWKEFPWKTFVIGGAEEGEDLEVAVRREVREETGYKNFESVTRLYPEMRSEWYANHKNENRYAHMHVFVLKLADGAQDELAGEEKAKHGITWVPFKSIPTSYGPVSEMTFIWDALTGKGKQTYTGDGVTINSGDFSELPSEKARWEIVKFVKGERKVQYRLRDWLISRQRYWGSPIPMIYCAACAGQGKGERKEMPGWYAVPEEDLPVLLPYVEDFRPKGTGVSPLATVASFYQVKCPVCGGEARRETDVSDTFLDSAWYYLRYLDPKNTREPFDKQRAREWLPVHMYIGGAEHAVLHLLYVRFLAKVFHDWGLVQFDEPAKKFRAHGLLIREGKKISKSKGNVVNPDAFIEKFGADALRLHLMFLGPFEEGVDFRDQGILGPVRFLERVWKLSDRVSLKTEKNKDKERILHHTIKKVTEDIENLRYNTAISALMVLLRELEGAPNLDRENYEKLLLLLAPFAPHLAEELWEKLGHTESIHRGGWPKYDSTLIKEDVFTLVIQVNGRLRDTLEVLRNLSEAEVQKLALEREKIKAFLGSRKPKRMIYIPHRLLNIVI